MKELDDWNCCGATAYMAVDENKAFALAARNLALAEQQGPGNGRPQIVAPCSACYLVLKKTQHYVTKVPAVSRIVAPALQEAGLEYRDTVDVRHPLDIIVNDYGLEAIAKKVQRPLKELRIACYYGCQILRPYATFDDQRDPTSLERLAKAVGAESVEWPLKARCCGGSLIGTIHEVGLEMSYNIVKEASRQKANVIITTCSLCQFNLESYQREMSRQFGEKVRMPVIYFTQLVGLALGLSPKELGFDRILVPPVLKAASREGGEPAHV
jgi:heterodisulfide reductase subunit B